MLQKSKEWVHIVLAFEVSVFFWDFFELEGKTLIHQQVHDVNEAYDD